MGALNQLRKDFGRLRLLSEHVRARVGQTSSSAGRFLIGRLFRFNGLLIKGRQQPTELVICTRIVWRRTNGLRGSCSRSRLPGALDEVSRRWAQVVPDADYSGSKV